MASHPPRNGPGEGNYAFKTNGLGDRGLFESLNFDSADLSFETDFEITMAGI